MLVIGVIAIQIADTPEPEKSPQTESATSEQSAAVVSEQSAAAAAVVSEQSAAEVEAGLTPQMVADLVAAARVPSDVAAYSASMNVAPRWQRVWESNAVQNLVSLPTVQQAWMQMQRHPAFTSFIQTATTHPLAVEGLPVLHDAVSNEIFVYAGPDYPDTSSAISELHCEMTLANLKSGITGAIGGSPGSPDINQLIESVLAKEERLKVPSILIGCRLNNVEGAKQFLDK
jgi:hypothetical protein